MSSPALLFRRTVTVARGIPVVQMTGAAYSPGYSVQRCTVNGGLRRLDIRAHVLRMRTQWTQREATSGTGAKAISRVLEQAERGTVSNNWHAAKITMSNNRLAEKR